MLMDLEKLVDLYNMKITGVLHVGAHEAEEHDIYSALGVPMTVWVEANPTLAMSLLDRFRGDPFTQVVKAAVGDVDGWMTFHVANNGQSSSLLELGTHRKHHPEVEFVDRMQVKVSTLDTLVTSQLWSGLNFWNLDIQGMELAALQGASKAINMADYIYTEVNRESVYEGCGLISQIDALLSGHGFGRVETVWTQFEWGDALYIREDLL